MKKQILELQNYFINKILKGECTHTITNDISNSTVKIETIVDEKLFAFNKWQFFDFAQSCVSFMQLDIEDKESENYKLLRNYYTPMIEEYLSGAKEREIKALENKLAELTKTA